MKKLSSLFAASFLIIAFFSFSACEKDTSEKVVPAYKIPDCVTNLIDENGQSSTVIRFDGILQYVYQNQKVYLLERPDDDGLSTVINKDCEVICQLGGLTGSGDGQCPNFYDNACNEKRVWPR